MPPTAVETARTLASGHLPGRLTLFSLPEDVPVPHVTTAGGHVLLAARPGSRAWRSLAAAREDETAVLTIDDVPPFPQSPSRGRVHVCGWFRRVIGPAVQGAASAFAAASPLGVMPGLELFELEVGEVWLDQPDPVTFEPEEFAAAAPDPLHPWERDLLVDLREYHAGELAGLVPGHAGPCLPVRLDQYGLVLAAPELYRVEFPEPADCPRCVAHALRLTHTGHT